MTELGGKKIIQKLCVFVWHENKPNREREEETEEIQLHASSVSGGRYHNTTCYNFKKKNDDNLRQR